MPRLPSANDLGRIGYDTRAAIPSGFSDNIGPAVRRLGATLGGIGEDLAAEQKKTDKEAEAQQEYADNLRFVQWRDQQNQAFTEATRTAPEGASGFTANWIKQYDEGAREFIGQVPAPLKQTFDAKLFTERQQLLSRAQIFERNAGDAATLRGLSTSLDTLKKQITTDPDKADQYIAEGRRLIEGAPLPTEDRVKQFDDWKKDGSLAVITRRLEAGVYAPVATPVGDLPRTGPASPQEATDAASPGGTIRRTVDKIIGVESGGNANARNPRSSASGLGQFTDDTWVSTVRQHRPDLAGRSRGELLALKSDAALGREMTEAHTRDNADALAAAGMPTTEGALYLAHFAGIGGAKRVFTASDETSVLAVLGPRVVEANPFLRGKTIGWLKSWSDRKMQASSRLPAGPQQYLDRSLLEADPHYKALDYETQQRVINAYEADAKRRASEAMVAARASLEPRVADAQVAFETQGRYDGQVPTLKDFTDAYGPQEGADRYDDFAQKVVVGEEVFGLRLTPNAQIVQAVEAAKPASAGEGIADQQARYETIAKAADLILKQREADPVGFVMQNVPAVREAWDGVERGAVPYSQALQATTAAQQAIGIPASKIQPLPKQQAAAIEGVWKNTEAPEADRIGAVTSALFSTPDPDQRRAVFKQLVDAGLPEYVEGALQAFERGDQGAARRLMQAALVDPTKLPGKLAAKPSEIDDGIQNQLLAEGSVGDIYYGLADGAVENYEKARRDATLLNRAVMMRLTGGEDLETAVEGAGKDLFGDVVPLPEDSRVNAQVLISSKADPEPVIKMLQAYKRTVAMTLSDLARDEIERTDAASGNRAVLETVVQNRIEDIMENGYFVERNGGYVFMDPYTGLPVATADGEPLVMDKAGPSGTDTPPPASAIEPQAPVQGLLGEAVPDMGPVEAEALRQLMGTE